MIKVTMKIDGMSCGMCEAHINDAIRKVFSVKKVTSSHRKGITELLIQDPVDTQLLKHAVEECGYKVLGIHCEPYERQGFSLFKRK
ncbi:MAG TPA: heavy-metal-associated domain-containing protein [Candidatus Faeciplasma pullistercoris]|uniref:Heavy-metal-associated domain-containing protein n=1 Tax=Candidatus Faeciplasma pullistercoris TaxID=2840800 RepID=A0A9D1GTX3_9FIRM|nr:heavy-metal-associated domain-containing protein [Candidatus Faeciplasma pullistercoris]